MAIALDQTKDFLQVYIKCALGLILKNLYFLLIRSVSIHKNKCQQFLFLLFIANYLRECAHELQKGNLSSILGLYRFTRLVFYNKHY